MRRLPLARGFTLVEVLVATALLALVMAGLLTAMRAFAQSETRIDARIRSDDDLRVTDRFLRAVLAAVAPRNRAGEADAPKQIEFAGAAQELRWVGVMPARHGAGGLYRFRLYGRPAEGSQPAALMLEFFPYIPGSDSPADPAAVQARAMATGSDAVRFRYQDDMEGGEQWLEDWPFTDRLPRRIGLSVDSAAHPWPELLVSVLPVAGPMTSRRGGAASGTTVGPQ